MDQAEWKLLKEIAELEKTPQGAYNIRRNGQLDSRNSTANIEITTKTEPGKSGIDIRVKPGTKHESVHIPVIISQTGLSEVVYNDFFIGEDCDIDIVAGCGIHNTGCETSQHDGVHTFYVGKNSKVRYVERHYGEGPGTGKRVMNPQTVVYLEEGELPLVSRLPLEDAGVQPELTRKEYLRLLSAAKAANRECAYMLVKLFATTGIAVRELPRVTVEAVKQQQNQDITAPFEGRPGVMPQRHCSPLLPHLRSLCLRSPSAQRRF